MHIFPRCILTLSATLLLTACPHHAVDIAEQITVPKPPENYRPLYLSSTTDASTLIRQQRADLDSIQNNTDTATWNTMLRNASSNDVLSGGTPLLKSTDFRELTSNSGQQSAGSVSVGTSGVNVNVGGVQASTNDELRAQQQQASRLPTEADALQQHIGRNYGITVQMRSITDNGYPDSVLMRVSVLDRTGASVGGLAPPYLPDSIDVHTYWKALLDSCRGTTTRIAEYEVTEIRSDAQEPHAIGFILDHSPSMGDSRARRLQDAIRETLEIFGPEDFVSVVKFYEDIKVEVPLTQDSAEYKSLFQVDGLEGYGYGTAVYDGAVSGIQQVLQAPEGVRKALILFSDGEDNSSSAGIDSVLMLAREHDIAIYTIAYGPVDERPLQLLARYSGGRMYRVYSSKEFPYVFKDIYRSLKNYYRVVYTPPECAGIHTAKVTVAIPELPGVVNSDVGQYDQSMFTPLVSDGDVTFVNIEFASGKADILPQSEHLLDDIAHAMLEYESLRLEVRGHTDDVGSEEDNLLLSQQRAESVANALVQRGVQRQRIATKGLGESQPLVPNDSDKNRKQNRRTEFVVFKGAQQ